MSFQGLVDGITKQGNDHASLKRRVEELEKRVKKLEDNEK